MEDVEYFDPSFESCDGCARLVHVYDDEDCVTVWGSPDEEGVRPLSMVFCGECAAHAGAGA